MPVYYTDISTYVNDKKVTSYNVGGKMIIYFKDLAVFGDYSYDDKTSSSKLNINGLPKNKYVYNIQKAPEGKKGIDIKSRISAPF